MKHLKMGRIIAAGFATAAVLASVGAATAPADAQTLKPEPRVSVAAQAAPVLKGTTAAKTVHKGAPSAKIRTLASQNGVCEVGDLCLYYYSSPTYGSGYDQSHNDQNLNNNHFIFTGSGKGSVVGNNAEAYWNRDPRAYAYVCTGINYTGSCGWLAPNAYGNLNSTYKNNSESIFWGDTAN